MTSTIPAHLLPNLTPAQLLAHARCSLADAHNTDVPTLRYAAAHLAALRAAAAVVAHRAQAVPGRAPVRNVWELLPQVAPELDEWAAHFDGAATTRASVEAGIGGPVTAEDAQQAVQDAETFTTAAEQAIR